MNEVILNLENANIYQQNSLILKNVNLTLREGEFYYLIGKTGSGKSSLLKILYGDLPLLEGNGEVVGFDLNSLKTRDIPFLRRNLGIIFQDFKLLDDRDIHDNLEFVLKATGWKNKEERENRIEEVLLKVGMLENINKRTFELSGGEQQRVAIARALLNNPKLILADEPTGNLDPKTSLEVMNLLNQIHKSGNTILMATHDYQLILKYKHNAFKCENGELFEVFQQAN